MGRQLPAGWYVDPSDAHQYRWWAGDQWTTHVRDKTEIDIAAAEEAMRPLPDFDTVAADGSVKDDGRRPVPVLLAVAVLVGIVATAGIVAFRPDTEGHQLTGEIRVATAEVAGWSRRADQALGDGAPCGDGGSPGVGEGTTVAVTSAQGDALGETSLGEGTVDRTANSTTCVFPYAVDGLDDALVYVVKVGPRVARRARIEAVEASNWTVDLRLG
jgi:Protein of unknown function (DUF2510)